jgi:hypothetical protein
LRPGDQISPDSQKDKDDCEDKDDARHIHKAVRVGSVWRSAKAKQDYSGLCWRV